ncbi:SlyX family protein [Azospira restricta]|uniref:SlyX family protein n=1 Tax=Azospira restricta TaxID=404405 RepID=A0A974SMN9_9RHOO|nr:SlyX family protein [Azospira restricta]QRJ62647.1 SlyX family protein [Azospira restricta]
MESAESRLTELEIKLSYAEDLVDTLNHTVFRQQEQIEALQRQLADLQRQVQAIPAGGARSLRDEVPPHY